jgi:hypothetical protein
MTNEHQFEVGDVVRFKEGTTDEESGQDLSGWQGRISEINADHSLLLVDFDSITLRNMPRDYLEETEEKGLGWSQYYIYPSEVVPAQPRDTEADVAEVVDQIEDELGWAHLGEEGRAINAILGEALYGDEIDQFEAWEAYLKKTLRFPFQARVAEWQEPGSPLRGVKKVRVLKIVGINDPYGVLAEVRTNHRFVCPLCDLKAADKSSPNHDPLQLYAVWYANR